MALMCEPNQRLPMYIADAGQRAQAEAERAREALAAAQFAAALNAWEGER